MFFISTPLSFISSEGGVTIARDIQEKKSMLDNLVELIVFTPHGTFSADPDFGFEYWNHEYSNVNETDFNNNSTGRDEHNGEGAKFRCQESVRRSLASYAPELTNVMVDLRLDSTAGEKRGSRKVYSRHAVTVAVRGYLDAGLGTSIEYRKDVMFLMEPTAKRA